MELEVKVVGGINTCFASLPLSLIQTLHSTRSTQLPELLALELRSPTHAPHTWFVTWSGATSASSAIEVDVSPQFAECVSLPNHITVQVRAATNVPHASLVSIEPHTEDDWEVLELNAEQAEDKVLNQVRIVHEGMRFPLWLHGHTVITFQVASVFPKNVVGKMMPISICI
ncbi:Peroxisome biogenesis protein 1, partial [Mucuna pruriens]